MKEFTYQGIKFAPVKKFKSDEECIQRIAKNLKEIVLTPEEGWNWEEFYEVAAEHEAGNIDIFKAQIDNQEITVIPTGSHLGKIDNISDYNCYEFRWQGEKETIAVARMLVKVEPEVLAGIVQDFRNKEALLPTIDDLIQYLKDNGLEIYDRPDREYEEEFNEYTPEKNFIFPLSVSEVAADYKIYEINPNSHLDAFKLKIKGHKEEVKTAVMIYKKLFQRVFPRELVDFLEKIGLEAKLMPPVDHRIAL